MSQNSGFTLIEIALVVALLAIAGVTLFTLYSKPQQHMHAPLGISIPTATPINTSMATVTPVPSPTPDPTVNWRTYTDDNQTYSLRIPPDWHQRSDGSFSYQEKPDATQIYRISDIVFVTVFNSYSPFSPTQHWKDLNHYYETLSEVKVGKSIDVSSSMTSLGVTVEKIDNLDTKFKGIHVVLTPNKDARTEPYRDEVIYTMNNGSLYQVSTSIPPSSPHYEEAIVILKSFHFVQ